MGSFQQALRAVLAQAGSAKGGEAPRPRKSHIEKSPFEDCFLSAFKSLGGVCYEEVNFPGPWDIEFDGLCVELDEALHFNRFRRVTLLSPVYESLKCFPVCGYRLFCEKFELACSAQGRQENAWSNTGSIKQFGLGGDRKDKADFNAPRWRQRALYDFMKDLSPLVLGLPMARIAIYDEVQDAHGVRSVAAILKSPAADSGLALASLIRQRAGQV